MNPLISCGFYNSLNCTLEGWVPLAVVGGAFSSFFPILLSILHIININISTRAQTPAGGKGDGLIKNYPNLYSTQMNIDRNRDSKKPGYIYLSTVSRLDPSPPGWLHDLLLVCRDSAKLLLRVNISCCCAAVMENIVNTQSPVDSHMTNSENF